MWGDVNRRNFGWRAYSLAAVCGALQLAGTALWPAHAAPFAYVASGTSSALSGVTVIDTAIDEIVAQVQIPGAGVGLPGALAVTADGKRVYWLSAFDSISVLGAVTNSIVATLKVTSNGSVGVNALAVAPDGKHVYLAGSAPGGGPGTEDALFIVIDTASGIVTTTLRMTGGGSPRSVVVDPTGARVYVGTRGTVTVIDTASNAVSATVQLPESDEPALALTADGRSLYVASLGFSEISVLNSATNTLGAPFKVPGVTDLRGIAIRGSRAYVLGDTVQGAAGISIIDTASNAVLSNIAVPGTRILEAIAFTPDGKRAFVSGTDNRITVLDTASNKIVDTLTVQAPTGLPGFAGAIAIVAPAQ
jgi:YVTN family beta-propeller protein